jgi:hypothetical protein
VDTDGRPDDRSSRERFSSERDATVPPEERR